MFSNFNKHMEKKLNICLLIPSLFDPDMPSRSAITEIYGHFLPSFGHKLTWITASDGKINYDGYEYFKSVRVYTVSLQQNSSKINQAFNLIKYYLERYKLINEILKQDKFDIIQVRNDVFDALIAIIMKRKHNIKFIFQYSFPKGGYKYVEKKSFWPYVKFEEQAIHHILRHADLILPISKWMKKDLVKQGHPKSKLFPLPMGVNMKLFSSPPENDVVNRYKFGDKFVFIYVGSLSKIRELDIIIDAFSEALNIYANLILLLVGDGDDKKNLESKVFKLNIEDKVIFTGNVPYYDVPKYIDAADVGLSIIPPLPIYLISSPTKIFEYMALKKPIIANNEIYEQREIIGVSKSGLLVEFDLKSIQEGFIRITKDQNISKKGENGFKWVKNNRTYKKMAKEVEDVYKNLIFN